MAVITPTTIFQDKKEGAAFSGLLDDVGVDAVAALGFYKLRTAYTGDCIQVRRASDSTTQDIGFDANGEVDTAAIASFCGSSQGTIVIWYDQSGNSYDFNTTNTPQAGSSANEPIIYFDYGGATGYAVTTDAAGNVACFSVDPGSTSQYGTRFLNSPAMDAKQSPVITIFGQVNTYNNTGIITTELDNGYNIGTYGASGNSLKAIRSSGANLITKLTVNVDGTDPFASTVFYCDDCGVNNANWYMTSYLNNVSPFDSTFTCAGFNSATYNNVTILRYYSGVLYQNMCMSAYIYWDKPSGTNLTSTEIFDLYDWVETNLGYTNNAP